MVSLYGPLVYRWCRRWGLQPADAENVGQEVFVRVSKHLSGFRPRPECGAFRGWLYRIARNCWIDHARRREREAVAEGGSDARKLLEQLVAEPNGQDDAAWREADDALLCRKAIELIRGEFSPRDWTAFYLLVVEEKSPAEIAAELNVSVNVVYLAKSRLLSRFRQEFGELIPRP